MDVNLTDSISGELRNAISKISLDDWKNSWKEFFELDFENLSDKERQEFVDENALVFQFLSQKFSEYDHPFWRVRSAWNISNDNADVSQSYSFPPAIFTNKGRANKESCPVFYCASDAKTALLESFRNIKPKEIAFLTKWSLNQKGLENRTFNVQPYWNFKKNSPFHFIKQYRDDDYKQQLEILEPDIAEHLSTASQLIADEFLKEDANYNFSSWFADRQLYRNPTFIDGILYPSVATGHNSANFALHPNFAIENMQLIEVYGFRYDLGYVNKSMQFIMKLQCYAEKVGNGLRWKHGHEVDKTKLKEFHSFLNLSPNLAKSDDA